jgi:phosphatidylglycerol lysyltransferase
MNVLRLLPKLLPWIAPVLFVAALFVLRREFEQLTLRELVDELARIPLPGILAALGFTALSYLALTICEWLAVRYAESSLKYRRVGPISFVCSAVGHNFGNAIFVGGALRARLYTLQGLRPLAISKVVLLYAFSYWIGYLVLAGFVFLLVPPSLSVQSPVGRMSLRIIGAGFLMLAVAYFLIAATPSRGFARKLTLRWTQLRIPALRIAVPQTILMALSLVFSAAALYALMGLKGVLGFPEFMGIFLLSLVTGMASQVPGGLGVFESAVFLLLPDILPATSMLGALLIFRLIFYLVPFTLSLMLMVILEARLRLSRRGRL